MDHNSKSDGDTFTSRDFSAGSDNDLSEDDYSFDSECSVEFSFASTDGEDYDSNNEDPPSQDDNDDAAAPPPDDAQDHSDDAPNPPNLPEANPPADNEPTPVPSGKSPAHFAIASSEAFYASFNIESVGEY